MTNEEAKAFLDNLKICIDEHPVVADWLVEIADRKTEQQTCEECKYMWWNSEAKRYECSIEKCPYNEPKDEPKTQMKTQNSNLTFEKDECAKEYEELGLKELKELIEADRKDEFFREPTAEERKAVADYIDSISVSTGVNIFDLMDEPTISKMEQVEDETRLTAKCLNCNNSKVCKEKHWDGCVYEPIEDEPQVIMPKKCKGCDSASKIIEAYSRGFEDGAEAVKAMPQTERNE